MTIFQQLSDEYVKKYDKILLDYVSCVNIEDK